MTEPEGNEYSSIGSPSSKVTEGADDADLEAHAIDTDEATLVEAAIHALKTDRSPTSEAIRKIAADPAFLQAVTFRGMYSGPLPPASELKKYGSTVPRTITE